MKVPVVTTTAMTSSSSSSAARMMVIMMALLLVLSSCNAFQSVVLSQSQSQQQRYIATKSTTRLYYRDYELGNGGGGKNGNDDKDNDDSSKQEKYFFASPIVEKDDDDKKVEKMIIKNFDDFDDFVIGHDVVVQRKDQDEKPMMTVADIWKENGNTAALTLPSLPNPNFSSVEVIQSVLRGLQYNDIPTKNTGIKRCYVFMDIYCKKLVTGYGALREERTLERFIEHSLKSPKLIPFMNAISIEFGPLSKIPGGQWRGEICTMPIKVISRIIPPKEAQQPSPESLKFSPTPEQIQNMTSSSSSSIDTTNIDKTAAAKNNANNNDDSDNDTPSSPHAYYYTKKLSHDTKEQTFMIRLQKQRRPPLQNCYIITEIIDVQTVESISRPLTRE